MYISYLEKQLTNQEAYDKLMEECGDYLEIPEDEPLFWYALADTQWKMGRLTPDVKAKAMEWIDKEGGLDLWAESKDKGAGWKKTLEKLRVKLESEQPKEKKIRKKVIPFQNPWSVNDVYAYKMKFYSQAEKGAQHEKYILIQKIGEEKGRLSGDIIMRVQVFDRLFDDTPTLDDAVETIRNCRLLPFDNPSIQEKRYRSRLLGEPDIHQRSSLSIYKPISMSQGLDQDYLYPSYPKEALTYICTTEGPANKQHERLNGSASQGVWDWLDRSVSLMFELWKGVKYEIIGDGTFEYPSREYQKSIKAEILDPSNISFWNIGDVYAYQFHTEEARRCGVYGKYVAIQKIGEERFFDESNDFTMQAHIFDKLFDTIPLLKDLEKVRLLPLESPSKTKILNASFWVSMYGRDIYPRDHLTWIGNMHVPSNATIRKGDWYYWVNWSEMDRWCEYFKYWQGMEYEILEEGVFSHTYSKHKK